MSKGSLVLELAEYDEQFDALKQRAKALLEGLSPEQANWRPAEGSWSAAQCIEHLILAGRPFLDGIDAMIAEGRAKELLARPPYDHPAMGRWVIRIVEPPYRIRTKTFADMAPKPALDPAAVFAEFWALQNQFKERIYRANGLDIGAIRSKMPAGFTLSLGQWFAFVAAHERRHLWQAEKISQAPGFPR